MQVKKLLSLVLILVIVTFNLYPALAASSEERLYREAGEILKKVGVLKGSETGDLMLNDKLKRQDMVVLLSRLYKKEETAKRYTPKNLFSDVQSSFYKPYIAWAVDQGLIKGRDNNEFGFDDPVTVQEMQTVLLRALGYWEEAKDWDNVPNFAKGLGLMRGLSSSSREQVTRGLMAAMTLNALRLTISGGSMTLADKLNLDIPDSFNVEAFPFLNKNTLKIEGVAKGTDKLTLVLKPLSDSISSGEKKYNIPLAADGRFSYEISGLEPGKYEYIFVSGDLSTDPVSITVPEPPFEIKDIRANNLKEIVIDFTLPVDKYSSQFISNYMTNAGSIKSVRLENKDKTVVLTLDEAMKNQATYKLSIHRIKSSNDEELTIKDWEFEAFDNTFPKVDNIIALGNKGLRIYMSEPIKPAKSSNFKIDGKNIPAQVETVDNVITLKYYSASYAPKEGKHTLSVSNLEDYAGYKGIAQDISFEIVKDTDPPKVLDVEASLEELVIHFDEEIDPQSAVRTNFYWKSGSSKRYPAKVEVVNHKVYLIFSGNNLLPPRDITLYIDSISDYTGNKLQKWSQDIRPVIDTTNPEVIGLMVSEDGRSIKVYFSKSVDGKSKAYYSIKDQENRTVSIRNIEGSGREYTIYLSAPLPAGMNTITIENIVDTTAYKNKMIPFTQQIYMEDVEPPEIVSYSAKGNQIIILFSKEMDIATVENPSNYLIEFGGRYNYLPLATKIEQVYDEKTYVITLPEEIDGKKVDIGASGNIKEMKVYGLKAANGVLLAPTELTFDGQSQGQGLMKKAELVEPDKIVVKFDQPIFYASYDDFTVSGRTVYDVRVDGSDELVIILDDKGETTISGNLTIRSNNSIQTLLGTGVKAESITIEDRVPPRIASDIDDLRVSGGVIELPFTEKLDSLMASRFNRDLIVESHGIGILDESEYTTSLDSSGKVIKITVKSSARSSYGYTVRLVENPRYIMDLNGNVVEYDGYEYYTR